MSFKSLFRPLGRLFGVNEFPDKMLDRIAEDALAGVDDIDENAFSDEERGLAHGKTPASALAVGEGQMQQDAGAVSLTSGELEMLGLPNEPHNETTFEQQFPQTANPAWRKLAIAAGFAGLALTYVVMDSRDRNRVTVEQQAIHARSTEQQPTLESTLVPLPKRTKLQTSETIYQLENVAHIQDGNKSYTSFSIPVKTKNPGKAKVYVFFEKNPRAGKAYAADVIDGRSQFVVESQPGYGRLNVILVDGSVQTASEKTSELEQTVSKEKPKLQQKGENLDGDPSKTMLAFMNFYAGTNTAHDTSVYESGLAKLVEYKNSHPKKKLKTMLAEAGVEWIADDATAYEALNEARSKGHKISRFDRKLAQTEMMEKMLYSNAPLRKLAADLTREYNMHVSKSTISGMRKRMSENGYC